MKIKKLQFPEKLVPYRGIIRFICILLVSNFIWKYTVLGDESYTSVTFFGINISYPFMLMSDHVATVSTAVLHFFGSNIALEPNNILRHDNGQGVHIIWACTGIKQAYIYMCIIAFSRGSWLKKLWYIPAGLTIVYLFNIFRIVCIIALIKQHPNWFDFLHEQLFKDLFYIVIFGMWVLWEEKIAIKK